LYAFVKTDVIVMFISLRKRITTSKPQNNFWFFWITCTDEAHLFRIFF